MNIKVTPHTIELNRTTIINTGEYNVTPCTFEFSEEFEGLTKQAVFSTCENTYKTAILNNRCTIPSEVLEEEGQVLLGVDGYVTENNELELRYSPTPVYFNIKLGSYKEGNDPDLPKPSEWEKVLEEVNTAIEETNNLNIDAEKEDHTTTITITKKDGTPKEVEVLDGVSLDNIEIENNDLIVTYGGTPDNLGQVVPVVAVGETITLPPSSSALVENIGTSLNPIFKFSIPKGEAGSIKFEIVEQLPTIGIKDDTIYLVPYNKITVQTLPTENIQLHTIYIVESTGKRYVYNGNEWIEISSDNQYIEYVYINNEWEELGSIGVDINLDDYYTKSETNDLLNGKQDKIDSSHKISSDLVDDTNATHKFVSASDITNWNGKVSPTDYATDNKGGVFKRSNSYYTGINTSGYLYALEKSYSDYQNINTNAFIGKGTLENVIIGKGLVSNTNYASNTNAGVVKTQPSYAIQTNQNSGNVSLITKTYEEYQSGSDGIFIGKGTLENVIIGKGLTTKSYVDGLVGDINNAIDLINGEVV